MKDLELKVSMLCKVCGNDQFSPKDTNITDIENANDETIIICSDCGHECSKAELYDDNKHIIDANIEDLKKDAIKQFEKELKKMFK